MLVSLSTLVMSAVWPPTDVSWTVKVHWSCRSIVTATTGTIFLYYWSLLYHSQHWSDHRFDHRPLQLTTLIKHSLPACLALMDAALSAAPYKPGHAYMPVVYTLAHLGAVTVYTASGGRALDGRSKLYEHLEWSEGPLTAAVVCLVALLTIVALHLFIACVTTTLDGCAGRGDHHHHHLGGHLDPFPGASDAVSIEVVASCEDISPPDEQPTDLTDPLSDMTE